MTYVALSFGIGSAAFAFLLAQALRTPTSVLRSRALLIALTVTLGWELCGVLLGSLGSAVPAMWIWGIDLLRSAAWIFVILAIFEQVVMKSYADAASTIPRFIRALAVISLGLTVLNLFAYWLPPVLGSEVRLNERLAFGAWLGISIAGLTLVEQIIRNLPDTYKWSIRPFCIGLGATYAFDLFCFADAFLFARLDTAIWTARGVVHAFIVPLAALSVARTRGWKGTLTVSRQIVFHSTAVLASGLYLLLVAGGGYYIRAFGGEWARLLQFTFVIGALLVLMMLIGSGTMRSRLRVWISKHFFSYRFDYRAQWLNFTQALSGAGAELGIYERSIKALSDLVESPGGGLWLSRDGRWRQVARWSMPEVKHEEELTSAFTRFLSEKGWVIDLHGARAGRAEYPGDVIPRWLLDYADAWIAVPLMADDREVFGFVVLLTPRSGTEMNWEVLDLLKTAGRQCASYLAQIEASEALLETKKFDAFNRLSAFVVHDLKNLIAQLSLLLKNAERHKDNPEFQKDLLLTVGHVVKRMSDMLLQLRSGTVPVDQARPVDLAKVLAGIAELKSAQRHRIQVEGGQGVFVLGHEDRLERVVGHLIQNALDASAEDQPVSVRVTRSGNSACIAVSDFGHGMSAEFVRDKLFKPFQSTKTTGMGIGAYESQQYITSLGGKLSVESEPGRGTTMSVVLPQSRSARHAGEDVEQNVFKAGA